MKNPSIVPLPDLSSDTIRRVLRDAGNRDFVFVSLPGSQVDVSAVSLERMRMVAENFQAGLVFSDAVGLPRIDCQPGSIRDDFDFGPLVGISTSRAAEVFGEEMGPPLEFGGWYDLRLRIGEIAPIVRVPEPLYAQSTPLPENGREAHFDYVDPSARACQVEMEAAATRHLRRIGAHLPARDRRARAGSDEARQGALASVIIPVRNRERTIGDAVRSALAQRASFDFNVIVVDNLSSDRTGEVLAAFGDPRLVVRRPDRRDLGIGGCWNLAIESEQCGSYALQLDSDDLFSSEDVLARVVEEMRREGWAMLVGSYTTVDFSLTAVPPGLVDHREWSADNGHNNLLRVNGLGAPRAYDVAVIRAIRFPNVSYGEDYAVGLAVSRDFAIGRIYDSLYWCRRWEGNTDNSPTVDQRNRFNTYKDWLRTAEIGIRRGMNRNAR